MIISFRNSKYIVSKWGIKPYIVDYPYSEIPKSGNVILKDRIAVIVGGNAGIGLSIVKTFLAEGARVIASARKEGNLSTIKCDSLEYLQWDVADINQSRSNIQYIINKYGRIDNIVLCAGVNVLHNNKSSDLIERKENEIRYIHGINVIGVCEICKIIKELSDLRVFKKSVKIINIISAGGFISRPEPYFTSKRSFLSFTEAFSKEAGDSIKVYGIAPGEISTPMIRKGKFTLFSTIAKDKRKGHPDEIAQLALLMASDAGDTMSGNVIVFDGAETIR